MSTAKAFNFKQVSETVSTAGLLSEVQLQQIGTEHYQLVINLLPHESEYAIKNEQSIVKSQGIKYEYIPVDFSLPLESDYLKFAECLHQHSDKKIIAHCAANYRVSAFYAIYAYRNLGWSTSQAYQFIGSLWALSEYPVWETFVSRLLGENNEK